MQTSLSLQEIENLCSKLYVTGFGIERVEAEQRLNGFSAKECFPQLEIILSQTTSPYVQLFVISKMTNIMTVHWNSFSAIQKNETKTKALSFLASKAPELPDFVITALVQLICRVVRLSWFDNLSSNIETVNEHFVQFIKNSSAIYYLIGLKLFIQMLLEIGDYLPGILLTEHRKTANSFRDKCMLQIFQLSLNCLNTLYSGGSQEENLKEQTLELSVRCLTWDFVGTSPEESVDDLSLCQIPTSWAELFENDSVLKLYLSIYLTSTPPHSSLALKCLAQLACIRPSLWMNDEQRDKFLEYLISTSLTILGNQKALFNEHNHYEFCRFLAKLKAGYQISKLFAISAFDTWIAQILNFTTQSFQIYQWSSNSAFFLLSFWSRSINSLFHLKDEERLSLMEQYIPKVLISFIESRLQGVERAIESNQEDEFDQDEEHLLDQLEAIPLLARFNYDTISNHMMTLFDTIEGKLKSLVLSQQPFNNKEVYVIQTQLAWTINIMGPVISARSVTDLVGMEINDANISARVFNFIRFHDSLVEKRGDITSARKLELALLNFLSHFRKVYVGDNIRSFTDLYSQLYKICGLKDEPSILNLILNKLINSLKFWIHEEKVISKTLNLMNDLSLGYNSSRNLLKLDTTTQMLIHHNSFKFLDEPVYFKKRTFFYFALCTLFFMDDEIQNKFSRFVEPFTSTFIKLSQLTSEELKSGQCKVVLICLFRDLYGLLQASVGPRSYSLIFNWIYPRFFQIIYLIAEIWKLDIDVSTPLFHVISELVNNKSNRINFEIPSVNGILLFRDVSKLLVFYGSQLLSDPLHNLYEENQKGIYFLLLSVYRMLIGGYCNYGVFELYKDPTLSNLLQVVIKLIICIPLSEILLYPKLALTYYNLMENICNHHLKHLVGLDFQSFSIIVHSLKVGLEHSENRIVIESINAIDKIVSFYLSPSEDSQIKNALGNHISNLTQLFAEICLVLFKKTLFEDGQSQWTISRLLFSLIVLNPEFLNNVKNQLLQRQLPECRENLVEDFRKLMDGVPLQISYANKDSFTTNFHVFVSQVRQYITD